MEVRGEEAKGRIEEKVVIRGGMKGSEGSVNGKGEGVRVEL